MDVGQKVRNFIIKLQGLDDKHKKAILWSIVVVSGLIMGIFWIGEVKNSISKIGQSSNPLNLPAINMPSTDLLQTTTSSN